MHHLHKVNFHMATWDSATVRNVNAHLEKREKEKKRENMTLIS